MFFSIFQYTLFTCICITVNAEMATSIIHANIFANHASANFPLSRILNFLFFLWDRWKITKHISFRPFKCMKIVNQIFVISKNAFHQFSINTAIMLNAVGLKVNIFSTCSHFNIPTLVMPCVSNFLKSLYNLYSLGIISFCIFNIFLCEENSSLNKVILNLAVCFYVNKTENQFISVAFQFVSDMPYPCKQFSWLNG